MAIAIFLHLRPHRHRGSFLQNASSYTRFYSSSSSNSDDDGHNRISQSPFSFRDVISSLKQSAPSPQDTRRSFFDRSNSGNREAPTQKIASFEDLRKHLSYFRRPSSSNSDDDGHNRISQLPFSCRDVKSSLKQSAPSPQDTRRSFFDRSNSGNREGPTQKIASFEDIRKHLSYFRRPSSVKPPQSTPDITFQELYKKNAKLKADAFSVSENGEKQDPDYLKSIRMTLNNNTPRQPQSQPRDAFHRRSSVDEHGLNLKLRENSLKNVMPESTDETKIEFIRSYSPFEIGENVRKLRPGWWSPRRWWSPVVVAGGGDGGSRWRWLRRGWKILEDFGLKGKELSQTFFNETSARKQTLSVSWCAGCRQKRFRGRFKKKQKPPKCFFGRDARV